MAYVGRIPNYRVKRSSRDIARSQSEKISYNKVFLCKNLVGVHVFHTCRIHVDAEYAVTGRLYTLFR